jgi:hypothetical protein
MNYWPVEQQLRRGMHLAGHYGQMRFRRKESIMRYLVFSLLLVLALIPDTGRAQLTAEPVVRFIVPEANALATAIALHDDTVLLGTVNAEAYVFQFDGEKWWMDRLAVPERPHGFFNEVALDEDVALIGSTPQAYVFRFDGATWVHEATLGDDQGDSEFGASVDVDGDLAVVGTLHRDVQVFRFDGLGWHREASLAPPPREDGKRPFGLAEYVVVDGDRVLVTKDSRIGDTFEGVYAFRFDGAEWRQEGIITLSDTETVFIGAIALDGDVAILDEDYDMVVHVFRFDGVGWKREAILEPPKLNNRNCSCLPVPGNQEVCDGGTTNFGVSVAIDGDMILVGANLDDVSTTDSGAAYLYRYDGAQWNYELLLQGEPTGSCGAYFGRLVSLHGKSALVKQGHSAILFRIR